MFIVGLRRCWNNYRAKPSKEGAVPVQADEDVSFLTKFPNFTITHIRSMGRKLLTDMILLKKIYSIQIDPELMAQFDAAASFLPAIASKLSSADLMSLYALYKQATCGPASQFSFLASKEFDSLLLRKFNFSSEIFMNIF